MNMTATAQQFGKLVHRMMPSHISGMPEGRLMVAIIEQAWRDAEDHSKARRFFLDDQSQLVMYCDKTGLNFQMLRELYIKHHPAARDMEAA